MEHVLVGRLVCYALPIRSPANKWHLSQEMWPHWTFPPYLAGQYSTVQYWSVQYSKGDVASLDLPSIP